jgi:hypothetical protein
VSDRKVHFIHVGKTGGTAVKQALRGAGLAARAFRYEQEAPGVPLTPFGRITLHDHRFRLRDLPEGDFAFFLVRDPVARFVSGFQSRFRKGQPRYFCEWSQNERAVFETLRTPEKLALALDSEDEREREFAEWSMRVVRHLRFQRRYLGRPAHLYSKLPQIVFIGRQETLDVEWTQLKSVLELPDELELPSDPVSSHRSENDEISLDDDAVRILRRWYAPDYRLLEACESIRAERGWGNSGGRLATASRGHQSERGGRPMSEARVEAGPLAGVEPIAQIAGAATDRLNLWVKLLEHLGPRTVAEIGVYRGDYAVAVLRDCPTIERYYLIDPWRHLDDWNKPSNRDDDTFQGVYEEALARTQAYEAKREVLRGRTTEVVDRIPDASLDFAYVDGDHTLRGVTIDLVSVYPKVRDGGWIGGDDFAKSIWQHGLEFEPTLVFPFAVHFAEAVGARIYGLPYGQFLIQKGGSKGFEFVDLVGKYGRLDLRRHMRRRGATRPQAHGVGVRARARALVGRARRRLRR